MQRKIKRPLLVFEDLNSVRHVTLFIVGRTKLTATPQSWLNPFLFYIFSFVVAIFRPELGSASERFGFAFLIMLVLEGANLIHSLGHMFTSSLGGAPMDELLITATRHINIYYPEQNDVPRRIHLLRSLGGPLANLGFGIVMFFLLFRVNFGLAHEYFAYLATFSLAAGLLTLLPIRSLDGEVIWRG
ncbi:MAG: hypothetical protein FVQ83_16460 [Chloroflexi bacterium]|nr:hypothetical protein [Chloroflexota bacterium]